MSIKGTTIQRIFSFFFIIQHCRVNWFSVLSLFMAFCLLHNFFLYLASLFVTFYPILLKKFFSHWIIFGPVYCIFLFSWNPPYWVFYLLCRKYCIPTLSQLSLWDSSWIKKWRWLMYSVIITTVYRSELGYFFLKFWTRTAIVGARACWPSWVGKSAKKRSHLRIFQWVLVFL